jgi:hypothetical protein
MKSKGTVDGQKDEQSATRETRQYLNDMPYEARVELISVRQIIS